MSPAHPAGPAAQQVAGPAPGDREPDSPLQAGAQIQPAPHGEHS